MWSRSSVETSFDSWKRPQDNPDPGGTSHLRPSCQPLRHSGAGGGILALRCNTLGTEAPLVLNRKARGVPKCNTVTKTGPSQSVTVSDALAVRNEVTRVFGRKSCLALRNHQRPGGFCEKVESRKKGLVLVGSCQYAYRPVSGTTPGYAFCSAGCYCDQRCGQYQ